MTYTEFYLKAILAMASNPKYVIDGELQADEIISDAGTLTDKLSSLDSGNFESDADECSESTKTLIGNISDSLFEIKESICEVRDAQLVETDDGLNPLQAIVVELNEIDKALHNISITLEEKDEE